MEKAILNVRDKRLTFTFNNEEFVIDVTGMEPDHWGTITHKGTNIEYDFNIWFDDFKDKGVGSFQLVIYELYENGENLEISNSAEIYDVISIDEQGFEIFGDDLEFLMFDYIVDVQSVDYIKQHYNRMSLSIDNESVNIYIDNGESKEPTHICYWHIDEVEEDSSVAISIANAINLFHTNKLKLIETLFGKVK